MNLFQNIKTARFSNSSYSLFLIDARTETHDYFGYGIYLNIKSQRHKRYISILKQNWELFKQVMMGKKTWDVILNNYSKQERMFILRVPKEWKLIASPFSAKDHAFVENCIT
jgi:hypothetical protein